ncbi:hypothetical protein WJX72_005348 [[Myrmecia] bisecta]|uniref:Integrator complex subunit 3 N-terminal domain-containing protein n=1 Tax=[Myrmecia] bisecta TaxID=41462 RepID=A0AAW1Q402_9CHLO
MPLAERPATALYERPPVVGGLELHRHWSESWAKHQAVLASESSADVVDLLQADIAPVPEVTCALLYAVLTDKANAARYLGLLNQQASRDRFACCTAQLNALVPAYYCCLKEAVRGQLLLLLRELVAWEAAGADTLCLALLRQVVSGSMEGQNVWLACSLVDVLRHQVAWMRRGLKDHLLLHAALYTVLRMLPEAAKGGSPAIDALRSHGSALAANLLTEHWQECAGAGRDLIRCLQDVSNMPEFRSIWAALLAGRAPGAEPGALPGQPDALTHVLSTRTPKDVLSSRLTPDAEVQLYFIMSQVRNGNHKRYQTWYTAKHLQGPHAETLIPDLVRYIVGVYHPANYVLASDIIPRWAVLGWLLQYPRTATGQANTRLALLFDWPFFVPQTDSIMNIEPAMLLMTRSIPRYATMTNALLEFLIIASEHFWPCGRALVRRGLGAAVDTLVKRGVVRNLNGLARCEEVAPHLRRQLDHLFPAHANSGLSREAVGRASTSGPADSTSPATSASEGPSSSTRPAQEPARDSAPSQAARREGRKHAWEEAGSSEGQDAKRLRVQAPGEAPPGQLSADDTSEQSEEMESEGGEEAGTLQQQLGQSLAALGAAAMQAQRAGELPDILRSLLDALAAAETGQTASAKKRKRGEQKEAEASATLDMLIKEAAASITSRVELAAESDGSMPWWQDAGMDEVREGHNGSGEGQAGGSLAGSLARWALEEGEAGRQHLALRLLADLRNSQATCTIENHNPGGLQRELFVEDLRICLAWGLPPFQRLLPALLRACPALFAANAPALYLLTAAADPPLTQRLASPPENGTCSADKAKTPRPRAKKMAQVQK